MALAQVKHVKRARQDQGECSVCRVPLPAGSEYRYYKPGFRSRIKVRVCMKSECTPKRSQLESSRLSDAWSAIEDAEASIESAESIEAVQEALDTCASAIRDLSSEYEDAISETPMLEDQLREKIDLLDQFADELEGAAIDEEPEKPDKPREPNRQDTDSDTQFQDRLDYHRGTILPEYETELAEWKEECDQALSDAKETATNVLSSTEF